MYAIIALLFFVTQSNILLGINTTDRSLIKKRCLNSSNDSQEPLLTLDPVYTTLIERDERESIKCLLDEDEGVLGRQSYSLGQTLLHLAVLYQSHYFTTLFLERGANPNQSDYKGATPLHYAVCECDEYITNLLLLYGADVGAENNDGATPLHCCVSSLRSSTMVAALLLRKNSQINTPDNLGNRPLHYAIIYNNLNFAVQLLAHHASPNLANAGGFTPLYYALLKENKNAFDILIRGEADIFLRQGGRPLIFIAIRYCSLHNISIISELIERGADIYSKHKNRTAEQYALKFDKEPFANLIQQTLIDQSSRTIKKRLAQLRSVKNKKPKK